MTGTASELGRTLERATRLAQATENEKPPLTLHDTGESLEGAAAAAQAALLARAPAILGPLFSQQVRSVAAAVAGRAPIITFSNDPAAQDPNAFVFGITASQSVSTILQYARSRGVRRVGLVADDSSWGRHAAQAAQRLKEEIGLEVFEASPAGDRLLDTLRQAGNGELPEAVLLTGGASQFLDHAAILRDNAIQLLGTIQAADQALAGEGAMQGAWLSMYDPVAFSRFAAIYQRAHGGPPGALAAIAFDAASIIRMLRAANQLSREALIASPGFPGVVGGVRFRPDGSCVRELTIAVVRAGEYAPIARRAGV